MHRRLLGLTLILLAVAPTRSRLLAGGPAHLADTPRNPRRVNRLMFHLPAVGMTTTAPVLPSAQRAGCG
jgi:hypothetical protein